tara:strand:+ start:279138 stop:280145 length:1008 start_codon:yes stop_codon:yes gene_type:complete
MILVTGGTGLVGAHLLYQLSLENETIVAIHRASSNLNAVKHVFSYYTPDYETQFNKIIWKVADINDITALDLVFAGITSVYHAAAIISFDKEDYRIMRKVNIEGTANLVNMAIAHKVKKFCFVSSVATVSKSANNPLISEESEWNSEEKNNDYAISKYGAETEVWRGSQEGLEVIIVNPGIILGAGFWNNGSGKLFETVNNGFKYYSEGITGYVSVSDVVTIMIRLMDSHVKNERYILVAENRSFKEVLFDIASGLGVKKPNIKATPFLGELAWRLAWLKSIISQKPAVLTKETARAGYRISNYSNQKIIKELNYTFESIDSSIKKICNFYKQDA